MVSQIKISLLGTSRLIEGIHTYNNKRAHNICYVELRLEIGVLDYSFFHIFFEIEITNFTLLRGQA